jgi:hypothetical protein
MNRHIFHSKPNNILSFYECVWDDKNMEDEIGETFSLRLASDTYMKYFNQKPEGTLLD